MQTIPIFQCNECLHLFTGTPGKHKTYPLEAILEAISTFNPGHSFGETQRILRRRAHLDIPERTTRSWLSTYKPKRYSLLSWLSSSPTRCSFESSWFDEIAIGQEGELLNEGGRLRNANSERHGSHCELVRDTILHSRLSFVAKPGAYSLWRNDSMLLP